MAATGGASSTTSAKDALRLGDDIDAERRLSRS